MSPDCQTTPFLLALAAQDALLPLRVVGSQIAGPCQSADSPQAVRTSPSDPNATNGQERWNSNVPGRRRSHHTVPYVRTAIHELPLRWRSAAARLAASPHDGA